MKNTKILIVYHYFPHYRLPLLRKLAKDESIEYMLLSGTTTDQTIKTVDSELANLPVERGGIRWKIIENVWLYKKKFLWQRGLLKECLSGKYSGIIFLGSPYFLSTWVALILCRLIGIKTFIWAHGIVRNKKRDKYKLLFLKLANGLLLYGNHAKENLIKKGYDPKKIAVIYNSLDYDKQIELRKKLDSSLLISKKRELFKNPDFPVLLFIGRLTPVKKLDMLLTICEKLHIAETPVNILFIGDGPEKGKLEKLVNEKSLQDFVFFYGECYGETELYPLIALADICVSPGNVGLTAMHSLTYGTPVITHNNPFDQMPEYEAIEPTVSGMLYEYGSQDSLYETIVTWLKLHSSDREQVRKSCYKVIDSCYNPEFQSRIIHSALLKFLSLESAGKWENQ